MKMEQCDNILSIVSERLKSTKQEDQFDVYGKNVATKLRILPNEQRIWAEKLINDVLMEAEFGNLNRGMQIYQHEHGRNNQQNMQQYIQQTHQTSYSYNPASGSTFPPGYSLYDM